MQPTDKVKVRDRLSRDPKTPRFHELPRLDGLGHERVAFKPFEWVEIEYGMVSILVGNDGFEITTMSGVPLRPVNDRNDKGEVITLRIDQVIASLDELTSAALHKRCQRYPEGERLKANASKETLINFLIENRVDEAAVPVKPTPSPEEGYKTGVFESDGVLMEMDDTAA